MADRGGPDRVPAGPGEVGIPGERDRAGGEAGEGLRRRGVHRGRGDGRGRLDPVLGHRRPDPPLRPEDRQDDRLPRAERPGQRHDVRRPRPAHRGRGRQHRRRPAGLGHRARRHRPDPGRSITTTGDSTAPTTSPSTATAGCMSPTRATSATSRASWISRACSSSRWRASSSRWTWTVSKPNGLAISPDGKTLYVSDNGPRRRALIAARIGDRGKVARSQGAPRLRQPSAGIDGMTVTTDGRIVAAAGSGDKAGAYVFSPDGKLLEVIPTPEDSRERRVRRRRRQDPLHLRRPQPLPDQDHHDRLPPLASRSMISGQWSGSVDWASSRIEASDSRSRQRTGETVTR